MDFTLSSLPELRALLAKSDTLSFDAIESESLRRFLDQHPEMQAGPRLGSGYVPIYISAEQLPLLYEEIGRNYSFWPSILSPVDVQANTASGITQVLQQPYLELSGRGVLLAIIDTGVDFTQEVFRYEDGSTKIHSLWDQTLETPPEEALYYGRSFDAQQINEALQSEAPFALIPSRDEDGHGTFLASVAAGRRTADYVGAAPDASLVVVKLRRAEEFFIRELLLPPDKPNYFHNADVMLGIQYAVDVANKNKMPVVICLGLGSNDSGHTGTTYFEEYISFLSRRPGIAVVTAAGNESRAKHHTQGRLARTGSTQSVGIRIGEASTSFVLNLFSAGYDQISVGLRAPTGEVLARVPYNTRQITQQELLLSKTSITTRYYRDNDNVVTVAFRDAKEGVWELLLYGDAIVDGSYHAWLPITYQVSPEVSFLQPVPEYSIVYPSNSLRGICCGAYDMRDGSLYASSSWGPTRLPRMAPDFVAPGVSVAGIYPTGPGSMTGTSAAAAVTAGAVALLLEWGLVQENRLSMDGELIRQMLIAGAKREAGESYPNVRWGYGKLDLYNSLRNILAEGEFA